MICGLNLKRGLELYVLLIMNNDLFMNDTLDNFIFTQTEDLFTKPSTSNGITKVCKTQDHERKISINEISFDDSIFLSESSFSTDFENTDNNDPREDLGIILQGNKSQNINIKSVNCSDQKLVSNEYGENETPKTKENVKNKNLHENDSNTANIINLNNLKEKIPKVVSEQLVPQDHICINEGNKQPDNSEYSNVIETRNKTHFNPDLLKLSSWGLPEAVLEKYESRNIINMFPWQVECLSNLEVLNNSKNLIYSAPTSAGKTLVAEILALKTIFERQKKVIFILPFVSIVREKIYYFQDILASSGIRVEGFMGSYNPPGGFSSVELAVCTIEKANNIINRLLEDSKLSDIGAMLVDEIHLLGDPSRGYLLELLLTKLKYITNKDENVNIQVVGMSATLPNLNHLAKWLNAELYTTNFRPIPLHEQAHVCGEIYDNNLKLVRKLSPLPEIGTDTDNILQLCLETIKDSCSVLIFCPTKNWCENLSQQIATAFFKIGSSDSEWGRLLRSQLKTDLIMELLGQLKYCPVGLDVVLRKTVSFGVAFHHAGLTMDERDIIEGAFRNGTLRVLVATSTLSSGVNLPARRVIIRTPHFHGRPIDTLTYRQMIGRAGRMGKDALGESFLICQKNDYKIAKELMSTELRPVESCLEGAGKLKRAILEVIASGIASTPNDVTLFTKCTLLAIEDDHGENLSHPIEEAVDFLKSNEFIRLQIQEDGTEKYIATSLGKACLSSSMPPDEGLALFTELEKARRCFVLETELHLIYLVTPYNACNSWDNIDWMLYLDLWVKLPSTMKRVGELVGVQESYIINATRGKIQTNTSKTYHRLMIHKRFFVALALQDLVNERPLADVCAKFNCNRGMLQSLQQSASSFAGMVTSFSHQLGWSSVEILLSQFQDRMQFGVSRELLDLMRLSILNGPMARILYNAGMETVTQLANTDVATVENILHKTIPFETKKEREGESEFDKNQRNKFRIIWVAGKEGVTEREAAEMLVGSARKYLKLELGLMDAKWENEGDGSEGGEDIKAVNNTYDSMTTSNSSLLDKNELKENECKGDELHDIKETDDCILESMQHNIKNDSSNVSITGNNDESSENTPPDIESTEKDLPTAHNKAENNKNNYVKQNMTALNSDILVNYNEGNKNKPTLDANIAKNDNCNISDSSGFSEINFSSIEVGVQRDKLPSNYTTLESTDFTKSCSFSDINFTKLEENIVKDIYVKDISIDNKKSFKMPCNTSAKKEISQLLLSPSQAELNISDSSVFSSHSNNMSADRFQSDQSLFDDSFNLHLSESDKESLTNCSVKELNNITNDLGNDECKLEKDLSNELNISDDILSSSLTEVPNTSKKRKNSSKENLGTPRKKKKNTKTKSRKPKSNKEGDHLFPKHFPNKTFIQEKLIQHTEDSLIYDIVDVFQHPPCWEFFEKELKRQEYFCLSLGCSRMEEKKSVIGMNIIQQANDKDMPKEKIISYKNRKIDGVAVTWSGARVYYCSLSDKDCCGKVIRLFKSILSNKTVVVNIFDSKEQIKLLYFGCGIHFEAKIIDPKIADWLLDPEGREKSLLGMAIKYSPETIKIAQSTAKGRGAGSVALNFYIPKSSRTRASVEALVTWYIMSSLKPKLNTVNDNYVKIYDVEMETVLCLARAEINGIYVRKELLQKLVDALKKQMEMIERTAFSLAGRHFNFASSTDVAKILGMFKGRKVSTRKQILEQNNHPISALVLQWRKMSSILIKTIYPLVKVIKDNRIRGCYIMQTATGRITMHEPNLQNVAKDFTITNTLTKEVIKISCRGTFQAPDNYIVISADYCQLELRILAYMSEDATLCNIMKRPGDVFRSIAAKWNKVKDNEVTDSIRQNTKHICYGIIYGMKSRALSKQLAIEEGEATVFMETFKNTYPGIKVFIKKTIETCRRNGYVETIFGRRRYLPNILEGDVSKKGQAERQAVNTTVQGSAADIAKKAMVMIENELDTTFRGATDKPKLVLHLHDELLYEVPVKYQKQVAQIIKKNMENCVQLSVPLPVKVKAGKSWGEMTEYTL